MIGNYCYMMLSFVLEKRFALIVAFAHFVYMVQKDLVDILNLVDQHFSYCFVDLC